MKWLLIVGFTEEDKKKSADCVALASDLEMFAGNVKVSTFKHKQFQGQGMYYNISVLKEQQTKKQTSL